MKNNLFLGAEKMEILKEFSLVYCRKRKAGFNPGRAFRSAQQLILEELVFWSCENGTAVSKEQMQQLEQIKKEDFLKVLEDTFDMTEKERNIYFNNPEPEYISNEYQPLLKRIK